jgi:hypothetical protein
MTFTDQDIIKQERRKEKTAMLRLVWLGAAMACTFALIALGDEHGLFKSLGFSSSFLDIVFWAAAAIFAIGGIYLFWKAKFSPETSERLLKLRIDEFQGQQRRVLSIVAILFVGFSVMTIVRPWANSHASIQTDFSIEYALLALAAAAAVCFGPGFMRRRFRVAANDEIVRLIRGRATQFGYMTAMVCASATYMIYLFKPQWTIVALPAAIFAGVMVPIAYFLVAERSTGQE